MPYISKALHLLAEAATHNTKCNPLTMDALDRQALLASTAISSKWADDRVDPDFEWHIGIPCAEWCRHMIRAIHCGRPMVFQENPRNMDGSICIIKHSISTTSDRCAIGVIQYFPVKYRNKTGSDMVKAYGDLRTGIYSCDASLNFRHTVTTLSNMILCMGPSKSHDWVELGPEKHDGA